MSQNKRSARMELLLARIKEAKEAKEAAPTVQQATTSTPTPPPPSDKVAALKAKIAAMTAAKAAATTTATGTTGIKIKLATTTAAVRQAIPLPTREQTTDRYGNTISYNERQQEFIDLAAQGKNCILIGAAGTGKTTCMKGTTKKLIDSGQAGVLRADAHNYLSDGTPGVIVVSYTRRATNNIRANVSDDMKANCITVHKLLEFRPVFYEVWDNELGKMRKTMSFEPSRNEVNNLPHSIKTLIVEEASMLGLDLWKYLIDALGHRVQWIFLGDINQLPPVFGPAILGYKLLQWKTVELTEVYRQALESPIIKLAHRILKGEVIQPDTFKTEWAYEGQLTLHAWKKKLLDEDACRVLAAFFNKAYGTGDYNPETDMILLPFNKGCGTIELNKYIANHLARTHGKTTYEVVAGFNKLYFTEGDKVLYEKEDAEIVSIGTNAAYDGPNYQPSSKHLDYWGHNPNLANEIPDYHDYANLDVDEILAQAAAADERVRQASHVITVRLADSGVDVSISSAGEVNALLHAYALTIHKAQGSEWDKVFLCLHQSHATMLGRELLYTAVTRAKKELYCICEPESFIKGINIQRIKGNTLAEKAEHFKGKLDSVEADLLAYIYKD